MQTIVSAILKWLASNPDPHQAESCQFIAYPAGPTLFAHGTLSKRVYYDRLIIPVAKMVQLAYNDTRTGWTDGMIAQYERLALDYAIALRALFGGGCFTSILHKEAELILIKI